MHASESASPPSARPRRRRAWWQWTVGVVFLGLAVFFTVLRIARSFIPAGASEFKPIEPVALHLPAGVSRVERLPAAGGEFAGDNVVLITLDTTRADRLGCYGNAAIQTPNLDAVARAGVVFARAYAPAPVTLPSHASMLTGLYPFHHGARVNGLARLADEHVTLAEMLADRGYDTAAFVSAFVLSRQFGVAQGFATFDYEAATPAFWNEVAERRGDATCDAVLRWFEERDASRPFFLWVHLYDPHWPYTPPSPFAEQYKNLPYDGEIAFADMQVGRVLKALDDQGVTERTLVVIAGDHGEGLFQHDESTHGCLIYDSTLHVPLIVRCGQKLGGGRYVDDPVGLIDLTPTILRMLGIDPPAGVAFDGIDLAAAPGGPRTLYHETLEALAEYGWAALLGIRVGERMYIHGPSPDLFDLHSDPHEANNLFATEREEAGQLRGQLAAFYGSDLEKAGHLTISQELSPADLAQLESLGYVTGRVPTSQAQRELPDPKAMMPMMRRVSMAFELNKPDWLKRAIASLEQVVKEHPDFYLAQRELATAYAKNGDYEAAEAHFRRCLELQPNNIVPLHKIAELYDARGEIDAALENYKAVLAQYADHFPTLLRVGQLLAGRGATAEALPYLERANHVAPGHAETAALVADLLANVQRGADAASVLRTALGEHPESELLRNRLARVLRSNGDLDGAVATLREGMRLDPNQHNYAANLALLLLGLPDPEGRARGEAVAIMTRVCEKTEFKNAGYVHALAKAYASVGRLSEAIGAAEQAQRIALADNKPQVAQVIGAELEQYRRMAAEGTGAAASGPGATSQPATAPVP